MHDKSVLVEEVSSIAVLEAVTKLSKDLKRIAGTLSPDEARFLVNSYYTVQKDRIRAGNQVKSLEKRGEPCHLLKWLHEQFMLLEKQIALALDRYSKSHPVGQWMRNIKGVGPVISAGLLAHLDIEKAPTAGHFFSFAGLNPQAEWKPGERRPWNARLKTLCWKLGESFVKTANRDGSIYGPLYAQRKKEEWEKNLRGEYVEKAAYYLNKFKFRQTTEAYKWLSGQVCPQDAEKFIKGEITKLPDKPSGPGVPMLPPGHIHERAKRWAVKIFLSNLHEVWYEWYYKKPAPAPYPLAYLGHAHKIEPANKIISLPESEPSSGE